MGERPRVTYVVSGLDVVLLLALVIVMARWDSIVSVAAGACRP